MLADFKEFLMKGNLVTLAVAFVIGLAFAYIAKIRLPVPVTIRADVEDISRSATLLILTTTIDSADQNMLVA